jgi:hypothetical protein
MDKRKGKAFFLLFYFPFSPFSAYPVILAGLAIYGESTWSIPNSLNGKSFAAA